jgi:hypothetical protein
MSTEKDLTAEIYNKLRAEGKTKSDIAKSYAFKNIYSLNKALKEMGLWTPGIVEKPEFAEMGNVSFKEHFRVRRQAEEAQERLAEYDRLKMVINDILHPNGDGPVNPSMCDIAAYIRGDFNRYNGQISELQVECDRLAAENSRLVKEVETLTAEQIRENLYSDDHESEYDSVAVVLGLVNGNKITLDLPKHLTSRLLEDIQRPNRLSRGICAQYIDDEFIAIDMQEVAVIQVGGLPGVEWIKPQPILPVYEFTTEQERYRVECKCGAEYFCKMNPKRPKARCRDCQETVFADRQAEEIIDPADGAEATLLTNRYFVSREPYQVNEPCQNLSPRRELREISKNHGREYIDPCRIVG